MPTDQQCSRSSGSAFRTETADIKNANGKSITSRLIGAQTTYLERLTAAGASRENQRREPSPVTDDTSDHGPQVARIRTWLKYGMTVTQVAEVFGVAVDEIERAMRRV